MDIDVNTEGSGSKGAWEFSVHFFAPSCEFVILFISK